MPFLRDGNCPPLLRWSEPAQIAGFTSACLISSMTVALLLYSIGVDSAIASICRSGYSSHILGALIRVVCYPFVETLMAQWLPILALKIVKKQPVFRIAFSSVIFALIHLNDGFIVAFASFFTGWILASAFIFCQQISWIKAYRVVSIANSVHNSILFFGFMLYQWLTGSL